jgi:rhodanese-related sulfurtransferase
MVHHLMPAMKLFKEVIWIIVISCAVGLVFNSFSPNGINVLENPWSRKAAEGSRNAEDPITFVGFERVCQFLENREGVILDARNPKEYAEGHIPGAQLLFFYNMNEYYPGLEEQLRSAPAILTYCSDVNCEDSEFLANELLNLGHMPVYVYKGGMADWISNQMTVARGMEGQAP